MKTKKISSTGRFGARYGAVVKERIRAIEERQRQKQHCIYCGKLAKRVAKGLWFCKGCGKRFTSQAYYVEW